MSEEQVGNKVDKTYGEGHLSSLISVYKFKKAAPEFWEEFMKRYNPIDERHQQIRKK